MSHVTNHQLVKIISKLYAYCISTSNVIAKHCFAGFNFQSSYSILRFIISCIFCPSSRLRLFRMIVFRKICYNVFYRYFDQYHYFDRLEARFVKYDDSDSESKNIIYLLCDVLRS
jgi:hypothetical protein